jgi:hypothetical protein
MELYSGAKMVNEKDLKTKYLSSKNQKFTVLDPSHQFDCESWCRTLPPAQVYTAICSSPVSVATQIKCHKCGTSPALFSFRSN